MRVEQAGADILLTSATGPGDARRPFRTVLIGTYELGHQPFGLASAAAWLQADGVTVTCLDLSRQRLDVDAIEEADLVAVHVPMHTATRLALRVLPEIRAFNPRACICFFGLYAVANEQHLRSHGVNVILGGEFEKALTRLTADLRGGNAGVARTEVGFDRLRFRVPDRSGLPPLTSYAAIVTGADRRVGGYTETTRGCRHRCRHCPVVPVYGGRLRIVQPEVVLADVDAQVAAGAEHITFGDPDFFNAFRHSLAIVEEMHRRHPGLSYDVTIKIEHLLTLRAQLPRLRETGCAWVTSAVESVDDEVLRRLDKGHTRADFIEAARLLRSERITLSPTFVMFHPWLSQSRYVDTLTLIEELDLVGAVAPVQLTTRLLIPRGSLLLELPEVRELAGDFDETCLAHPWRHPDPWMDDLQREVEGLVGGGEARGASRHDIFEAVWGAAVRRRVRVDAVAAAAIPHLLEPWYC